MIQDSRRLEVFAHEVGYGRMAGAEIESGTCDKCKRSAAVLHVDTSDGEYGTISLCAPCIAEAFEAFPENRAAVKTARDTPRTDSEERYDCGEVDGVALLSDQKCQACGHPPCPCCGAWCDVLLEPYGMCCDGACSYTAPPRFFTAEGKEWS